MTPPQHLHEEDTDEQAAQGQGAIRPDYEEDFDDIDQPAQEGLEPGAVGEPGEPSDAPLSPIAPNPD